MSQPKPKLPSIATYADHEVITPTNTLRAAVSTVTGRRPGG